MEGRNKRRKGGRKKGRWVMIGWMDRWMDGLIDQRKEGLEERKK